MFLRSGTYYFRARIPADLLEQYSPQTEIKFSLKTKDRVQAKKVCNLHSVKIDQEFEKHRQRIARRKAPLETVVHLSDEDVQRISNRWINSSLEADDKFRSMGLLNDREFEIMQESHKAAKEHFEKESAMGRGEWGEHWLEAALPMSGYDSSNLDSDSRERVAIALVKAQTVVIQTQVKRNKGKIVDTNEVAPDPKTARAGQSAKRGKVVTLDELFEDWKNLVPDRIQKTVDSFSATVRDFKKHVKDNLQNKPVTELTRKDLMGWCESLQKEDLHYKTIERKLSYLFTIFRIAVDKEKLTTNPAQSVRIKRPKVEKVARIPFERTDLQRIFSAPIYSGGKIPVGGKQAAALWLPLLALFTGARLEELGQLTVADIKQENEIDFINITDLGDGQSVKTASSRRRVPIHPELVKAGFIRYVEALISKKKQKVFPDLDSPDKYGKVTACWSKWWTRYMRGISVGITDKRKVFHCFRHTFKDACREAEIPEEIHDSLTGHVGGGVGRQYGSGFSIKRLASEMSKVTYPGLAIPIIVPDLQKST